MKVENNKIIEATEGELFNKWLDEEWFEIMSFTEYLEKVKKNGTNVLKRWR